MSTRAGLVASTVARIERYVDPECVLLFGSTQRGTATSRSDIDLLVIAHSDVDVAERRARIALLFSHWPVGLDVLWLTPDETRERLRQRNPFLCSVVLSGEPLLGDIEPYRAALQTVAEHA